MTDSKRRGVPGGRCVYKVSAVLGVCVAALSVVLTAPAFTPSAGASASGGASNQLRTAYYFGVADPMNFWSSDLSDAKATFRQMKSNGFNAVGLAIPWDEFQPKLSPPTENKWAFRRLDNLINLAQSQGMKVVLRLSFQYSVSPGDQLFGAQRQNEVFWKPYVYDAWLAYIQAIHANVVRYPNVAAVYLSWEDWYEPVGEASGSTSYDEGLSLAKSTGFRAWLESSFTLSQVSSMYNYPFTSWSQVPTPGRYTPAFALMFAYDDDMLVYRFFYPAKKYFRHLQLEARTDEDVVYSGNGNTLWNHSAEDTLDGTPVTGIYYSPYMGDPSSNPNETASQAEAGLAATISRMRQQSNGRLLYIHEFQFASNAPEVASAPHLKPGQISPFLVNSAAELAQNTTGYGLWTYRNFPFSLVYNPSFTLGDQGWHIKGNAKVDNTNNGLIMHAGSSANQVVHHQKENIDPSGRLTVSFEATTGLRTSMLVSLSGHVARVVLTPGTRTYQAVVPASSTGAGRLSIRANGHATVTNVEMYGFTQVGYVYSSVDHPQVALGALRRLNAEMAADA